MHTKRLALAAVFCLLISFSSLAHAQGQRFEDYSVKSVYSGKNAPAIITRDDRMFQTRLRWAVKNQKANFAGHYIFTSWGCGANCIMFSLIDARTGRVYSSGFSVCCWPNTVENPIEFRANSRLMIVHGVRNEEGLEGPHYYVWENGRLRQI
jgi:hypothetical protein